MRGSRQGNVGWHSSGESEAGGSPALQVRLVEPAAHQVGLHRKYELTFSLSGSYRDPFDPEDIDVVGTFAGPSGRLTRVPGFIFMDALEAQLGGATTGSAVWKIRWAPTEVGTHAVTLAARSRTSECVLELPAVEVSEGGSPGFVHCTPLRPGGFQFQDGRAFFPVAVTLWEPLTADEWERRLDEWNAHGANCVRLVLSDFNGMALEHRGIRAGECSLTRSRLLDRIFDLAEPRGIWVVLTSGEPHVLRATGPCPLWHENPYNRANGGPCETPADFFVNQDAKRLYRRKLRYLISRWGYSTHLFLVQFMGSANTVDGYDPALVRAWHAEMAEYVHQIDPYGHLVSAGLDGLLEWSDESRLFALPSLDVTLTAVWNARDMAAAISKDTEYALQEYQKPVLNVESGITLQYFHAADDEGVHFHNLLWGSALSGAAGCAAFWWTSYLREHDLSSHLRAVATFVEGEDPARRGRACTICTAGQSSDDDPIAPDLSLTTWVHHDLISGPRELSIPNDRGHDGFIPGLPGCLFPPSYGGRLYNPTTLHVDYGADGEFAICAWWLPEAGAARLRVRLDGEEPVFVDVPPARTYEEREALRHHLAPHVIPVGRGKHRIMVDNVGNDYVTVTMDLCNYLRPGTPNLRVCGLADASSALLWLQNRDNTWWRRRLGKAPRPVRGALVGVANLMPGAYDIEWWDTYEGVVVGREEGEVGGTMVLTLDVPEIERDVACKIRRRGQ